MQTRSISIGLSFLTALAVACGSDSKDSCEITVGEVAESQFALPSQLNRQGCEPESLRGFDPTGFWYVEEENSLLFSGAGPVRIKTTCGESLDVQMSRIADAVAPDYASFDDNDLFWRREQSFNDGELTLVQVFNACRLNADGTLFGRSMRCIFSSQGEDCTEREFSMQPFGRIEGEQESEGLTLLGEFDGEAGDKWADAFTANVRVADGVAYVIRSDGLRIVDVRDPAAMTELAHFPAEENEGYNDVKLASGAGAERFAILASSVRGAVVVDVTTPTTPTLVTAFTSTGEGIHTLFLDTVADETRAYLADGFSAQVQIYDVTNPRTPTFLGDFVLENPNSDVHDLYVENGVIYANATTGGLVIADSLANPAAASVLGISPSQPGYSHSNWVTTAGGRKISISGDEGYGAHAAIVDVDPVSPEFLGTIGTFELRAKVSVHNIMAFDDKAYMSHYQDGIRILDLSNPTSPTQVAYFNTWNPETSPGGKFEGAAGQDVDLAAGLIYVADSPRGLLVLQID